MELILVQNGRHLEAHRVHLGQLVGVDLGLGLGLVHAPWLDAGPIASGPLVRRAWCAALLVNVVRGHVQLLGLTARETGSSCDEPVRRKGESQAVAFLLFTSSFTRSSVTSKYSIAISKNALYSSFVRV